VSRDSWWRLCGRTADLVIFSASYETYKSCEYVPCLPLQRLRWFMNLWMGSDPGELFAVLTNRCRLTCH